MRRVWDKLIDVVSSWPRDLVFGLGFTAGFVSATQICLWFLRDLAERVIR